MRVCASVSRVCPSLSAPSYNVIRGHVILADINLIPLPAGRAPYPPPLHVPTAHATFFAGLRWSHLADRDGNIEEVGELLWFAEQWLSAESAFIPDSPLQQSLETLHGHFQGVSGVAGRPPRIALAKVGKLWLDTAFAEALQTWERPGVPRQLALTERLDSPSMTPGELLRARWHSALATQSVVFELLGHEPNKKRAIDNGYQLESGERGKERQNHRRV